MRRAVFVILTVLLATVALVSVAGTIYAATVTISVHQSTLDAQNGHSDIISWQFIINQIDNDADVPPTIHVTWSNGDQEDVPFAPGKGSAPTAHYITTQNQGYVVTAATAQIYSTWSGNFNLSDFGTGDPVPPVPELPAGLLFGIGLVGIGGFVIFKKYRAAAAAR